MTVDMNKGITDIEYNNLNLPQKIYFDTGNTTEYLYDAGGAKRQVIHETKRHIPSGELSEGEEITVLPPPPIYTQTDYCGTVVYEDRKVKRILTPEGYLSPKEEVATRGIGIGTPVLIKSDYDYNYFINDYLGNVRAVLTWEEENPYIIGGTPSTYSLTQRNDYYAFGLPTLNSTHSEAQPYKREGKEYDEMHGLNTYDQGARQFNTHLPITPTPDPLAEKYYSISPYAQWANNPVRYVDPDGMMFTPSAWRHVNRLVTDIDKKQKKNNEDIAEKQNQLSADGLSKTQENNLITEITKLATNNSELTVVRAELFILAMSNQMYDIEVNNYLTTYDPVTGATSTTGMAQMTENGYFTMTITTRGGLGLLAHELKHAFQFEIGTYSVGPELTRTYERYPNLLYDLNDEFEAHTRGSLFGAPNLSERSIASNPRYSKLVRGPIDFRTMPTLNKFMSNSKFLQQFAKDSKHTFRINGVTYYGK